MKLTKDEENEVRQASLVVNALLKDTYILQMCRGDRRRGRDGEPIANAKALNAARRINKIIKEHK